MRLTTRSLGALLFFLPIAVSAGSAIQPVSVCEILKDTQAYNGKIVAVLGRFSFRKTGRLIDQEGCSSKPGVLTIAEDAKLAPAAPPVLEIDAATVSQKLRVIRQHTNLRPFRFGSQEYDRWAVVYGKVEIPPASPAAPPSKDSAPASAPNAVPKLLIHGDGVIILLADEQVQ